MHRNLSIRNKGGDSALGKTRKLIPSLRGTNPESSRRLAKLIKSENHVISSLDSVAKEQNSIAAQLSEWGEQTGDDGVSEISDKLGVLLAEIAEQEDNFAQGLEESRGVLKAIRNTENSVQPSRDHKAKIHDEIQKLKYKEPTSPKIVTLEQELVRAEAQSLVAEAQLTNITRQKLRQAYDLHLRALLERSAKQTLLAHQARRVLALLDDTPIVPGETRAPFAKEAELRGVLSEAEDELRAWAPNWEALPESATPTTDAGVPASVPDSVKQEVENITGEPVPAHAPSAAGTSEQATTGAPSAATAGEEVPVHQNVAA